MRQVSVVKAALISIALMATPALAVQSGYEGFDYPAVTALTPGGLNTLNGGPSWVTAWSASGTGTFNVTDAATTPPTSNALPAPPVGNYVTGTGGNGGTATTATRQFAAAGSGLDMDSSGTIFSSFLFRKNANGGTSNDNVEFGFTDTNFAGVEARFGSTSGDAFFINLANPGAGGTNITGNPLSMGTDAIDTYFVILKVTAVPGTGTDTLQAKIYDSTTAAPPTVEPTTWDLTSNVTITSTHLNAVRMTVGGKASGAFDEIQVGDTFADIMSTPEPGSLGLLGIAVLVLCRRRR